MKRRRSPLLARDLLCRIEDLEAYSHPAFDFTELMERIEKLEREVKRLKGSTPPKKKAKAR